MDTVYHGLANTVFNLADCAVDKTIQSGRLSDCFSTFPIPKWMRSGEGDDEEEEEKVGGGTKKAWGRSEG